MSHEVFTVSAIGGEFTITEVSPKNTKEEFAAFNLDSILTAFRKIECQSMFVTAIYAGVDVLKMMRLGKGFIPADFEDYQCGLAGYYNSAPVYIDPDEKRSNMIVLHGSKFLH
jgi:hypothetical protein